MKLHVDHFTPFVGTVFMVEAEDGTYPMELLSAEGRAPGGGAPGFNLLFSGTALPGLPQGTYRFGRDGWAEDIFVVPLGVTDGAMRYEAVFN